MKMNQSGRSMVEMLGVLAIVGVLSIGGIMGYTSAMNRYRASRIMDMASKVSVVSRTINGGAGGTVTVNKDSTYDDLEWPNTIAGVSGFSGDEKGNVELQGTVDAAVNTIIGATAGSNVYDTTTYKFNFGNTNTSGSESGSGSGSGSESS